MIPVWLGAAPLLSSYLFLLGLGVIAAAGLALFGDAAERLPLAPFGPPVLVAAVTCFGGAGVLALRLFRFTPGLSLLAAALFAALSAALFCALATLASREVARRAALADLVGALARVVTPIEPGGVGLIATNGARPPLTLPATSRHDRPLPPGATVVVTGLHGDAAEVAPLPAPPAAEA